MTPPEFERVATRLAELEDYLQDVARELPPTQRAPWAEALRLTIAVHGQLQIELQHPELASQFDEAMSKLDVVTEALKRHGLFG